MEAVANEEGAVDAAAKEEESEATEEMKVNRHPRLSKITRGSQGGWKWRHGQWRSRGGTGRGSRGQ